MALEMIQDYEIFDCLVSNKFNQTATARDIHKKYKCLEITVEQVRWFLRKRIKANNHIQIAIERHKNEERSNSCNQLHKLVKSQFIRGFNENLTVEDLTKGSNAEAEFLCAECGSKFCAQVKELHRRIMNSSSKKATGCPFCAGKQVNKTNCFANLFPEYLKYWDYEKNLKLPYEVTPGNDNKFWFMCAKGHSFDISLCNLTSKRPRWCPQCTLRGTSYLEIVVYFELESIFKKNVFWQKKSKEGHRRYGVECDILIDLPKRTLCIEIDGMHHGNNKAFKRDIMKNQHLESNGVKVIRVRSERLKKIKDHDLIISSKHEFKCIVDSILNVIQVEFLEQSVKDKIKWYLERSGIANDKEIRKCHMSLLDKDIDECFLEARPDLHIFWNINKNLPYSADCFSKGSRHLVHWKCPECESEWEISVREMVKRKNPCMICFKSQIRVVEYQKSIAYLNPEVLDYWDYHNNNKLGLDPSRLNPWTEIKAHWKCEFSHNFLSPIKTVVSSIKRGFSGCKACKYNRNVVDIEGDKVSVSQLVDCIKSESTKCNISLKKASELFDLGFGGLEIRAYSKLSWAQKLEISKKLGSKMDLVKFLRSLIFSVISQRSLSIDEIYQSAINKCSGNISAAERLLGLRPRKISDYYRKKT